MCKNLRNRVCSYFYNLTIQVLTSFVTWTVIMSTHLPTPFFLFFIVYLCRIAQTNNWVLNVCIDLCTKPQRRKGLLGLQPRMFSQKLQMF